MSTYREQENSNQEIPKEDYIQDVAQLNVNDHIARIQTWIQQLKVELKVEKVNSMKISHDLHNLQQKHPQILKELKDNCIESIQNSSRDLKKESGELRKQTEIQGNIVTMLGQEMAVVQKVMHKANHQVNRLQQVMGYTYMYHNNTSLHSIYTHQPS